MYINHYKLGGNIVNHKGKNIYIADNIALANYLNSIQSAVEVGIIPAGYEHRPDLISNLFYGTVKNDWLLVMINNIKDPFQQLNVGDKILIPKI